MCCLGLVIAVFVALCHFCDCCTSTASLHIFETIVVISPEYIPWLTGFRVISALLAKETASCEWK